MATFISVHKNLNFNGMQFVNGIYNTENAQEINLLSNHPAAKRHGVARIDNIEAEETKETVKEPSVSTSSKKIISKKK